MWGSWVRTPSGSHQRRKSFGFLLCVYIRTFIFISNAERQRHRGCLFYFPFFTSWVSCSIHIQSGSEDVLFLQWTWMWFTGVSFALSEIFVFTTNREMNRSFEMQFVFCILPLKNQRNNNIYYIFFVPLHGIMIFIGIWTGRRTMADGVSDQ